MYGLIFPIGFHETMHFIRCPKCNRAMYLLRGTTSDEVGLSQTKKVVGTLMGQKGASV